MNFLMYRKRSDLDDRSEDVLRWMWMRETRGCEGDGWEIAWSDARESETIMKVLAGGGDGKMII